MLKESINFCEKLELKYLPFVPYSDKIKLPALPGVYFVVECEIIVYIGTTDNFNYRFLAHNRKIIFNKLDSPLIYYLICNDETTRKVYEKILIGIHNPKFNEVLKREGLELLTKCVYCGSLDTSKNGKSRNKDKTQRYKCNKCGSQFTPYTGILPFRPIANFLPLDHNCCSAKLWKSGYHNGHQMYKCRHCKKTYIDRDSIVNKDQ